MLSNLIEGPAISPVGHVFSCRVPALARIFLYIPALSEIQKEQNTSPGGVSPPPDGTAYASLH